MNTELMLQRGLGLLWFTIAVFASVGAARGEGRGGFLCAVLGLAFATAVSLRWHVDVLFAVRGWLRELDIYEQRGAVKLGIGLLLAVVVAAGVRLGGRHVRSQPPGLRLAIVVMLGFGLFLFALTAFLDALLPAVILHSPGRQLLELGFAATAAYGIATWRQHAGAR